MQAPWYYQATQATLKHQRIQEDKIKTYEDRNTWYKKGLKEVGMTTYCILLNYVHVYRLS